MTVDKEWMDGLEDEIDFGEGGLCTDNHLLMHRVIGANLLRDAILAAQEGEPDIECQWPHGYLDPQLGYCPNCGQSINEVPNIRADERAKVLAEVVGVLDAESVACQGNAERTNALNWAIAELKSRLAAVPQLEPPKNSYEPCEPCKVQDHDNCTGDCPSMCCALDAAEKEIARLAQLEPRLTAVHNLRVTIEGDWLRTVFTCTAPQGADCRLTCPEGCEYWVYNDHEHELADGECNARESFNCYDWLECHEATGHESVLYDGPVNAFWDGEDFQWQIDKASAAAPLPQPEKEI